MADNQTDDQVLDALEEAFTAPNVGDYDTVDQTLDDDYFSYDASYDDNSSDPANYTNQADPNDADDPAPLTPEQERLAQLEQRLHQRDLEEARATNQILSQRLAELEAKLNPQGAETPAQPAFSLDSLAQGLDLTDEEAATYAQSQGVIEKLARKAAIDILRQYDQGRVTPVEQSVGRVSQLEQTHQQWQQQQEQARQQTLVTQIQAQHPWLNQQVVQSAQYQAYLQERIPGTPYNRGQMISQGVQSGDLNLVNEIIAAYPGNPANGQQTAPTRQLGVASSPGRANVTPAPRQANGGQRGVFDYNTYLSAHKQLETGAITMEQFSKIEDAYFSAVAEGRVKI